MIKVNSLSEEHRSESSGVMQGMLEELRLLREGNQSLGVGNQSLQENLGRMTR